MELGQDLPMKKEGKSSESPNPNGDEPEGSPERRETKRLISYVYNFNPEESQRPKQNSTRIEIGKKGVEFVMDYEKSHGRIPEDMDKLQPNHPGFDIKSVNEDDMSEVRYIEVKSFSGIWDAQSPARLTKNEFETAKEYGEKFWLYVCEKVDSDPKLYSIKDPANQVNYYLFDHGWENVSQNGE